MKRLLCTLALLALAAPAAAQTHYCDAAQPTAGTAVAGAPITVEACADGKDANNNPTTLTGWALYDNGTRTQPSFVKGTTSPVSGKSLYTLSTTAPATASVHTYQVAEINGSGEGPKGPPFVLTVNLPATVPTAPTNLTVQ